ncbi:lipoyl protein ligase domain-containing protein [Euzebya tangerina]|uniref:lipoyl protein ligase domain-containing protein n=1 Tax=Euzebya tangerina TaxID=591198 RepID=UPI000E30B8E4|nr:lipoate--protein ligase family protein [Euzebya tangerina]
MTEWVDLGLEQDTSAALLERSVDLLAQTGEDGRPRLRWYLPTDQAIVLGRGQRDPTPVDGYAVIGRPSGGGAVLMDRHLLSLDVILPTGHPWLAAADLGQVFDPVGQAWADALTALGVPGITIHTGPATATRLGPPEQRPLAEICYASLGRGEVSSGGQKLVGLSQRRRRHGALIQCGLLRRWRPDPLIAALDVGRAAQAIRAAAIGLDDVTQDPIENQAIIEAVSGRVAA